MNKISQAQRLIERAMALLDDVMQAHEVMRERKPERVQRPGNAAQWIKRTRRSMGLTQIDFAAQVGVSSITVSRWENGVSEPLDMALTRIAELVRQHAGVPENAT